MNKKFSTLVASFLLAGSTIAPSFADSFTQVAATEGFENQYYYVFVNGSGVAPTVGEGVPEDGVTSGVLDIDANVDPYIKWSYDMNKTTLWTVEVVKKIVNGQESVVGYKLINAQTGEPLSVVVEEDGKDVTYDTFTKNKDVLEFVTTGKTKKYYNGTNGFGTEDNSWHYSLQAAAPFSLTADQLEDNFGDGESFSLAIGYEADANEDGEDEWIAYPSYEGGNVFDGAIYAEEGTYGLKLYKDAAKTKQIVLTTDKWEVTSSTLSLGNKFAVMTQKELAEAENIKAKEFQINVPAIKGGEPVEVVAVTKNNSFEVVVSVVKNAAGENVNRLTVAKDANKPYAEYTKTASNGKANTYITLGDNNYIDYSVFYGKVWNIYNEDGEIANPSCDGDDFVTASHIAAEYPEGQWIWDDARGAFINRESGNDLSLVGLREVEGKENVYTNAYGTYTFVAAGEPSENATLGYVNGYDAETLKMKAFTIGAPISVLGTPDTVYLVKGTDGALTYSTEKADAVEFRFTIENATTNTTSYVWGDEKGKDILHLDQYAVTEAVTGDKLTYNATEKRYELTSKGNAKVVLFKNKDAKAYNILLGVGVEEVEDTDIFETVGQAFCKANKMYNAFQSEKVVNSQSAYRFVENDLFVIEDASANQYRGDFSEAALDTIKIFRNDDNSYVLYEKGAMTVVNDEVTEGFLGMENFFDPQYAEKQPALLADTAIHAGTYRPQYMFAVEAKAVPAGMWCPIHGDDPTCPDAHKEPTNGYISGRYLVALADSANACENTLVNKFTYEMYNNYEPYYRLGFVQAKHEGDSLIIASTNDTIDVAKGYDLPCTFALKYVDAERDAFTIETMYSKAYDVYDEYDPANNRRGYIKYHNGIPVVTPKASEAWVFDLEELEGQTPTANEDVEVSEVSIIAVNGSVIVKGAAGKTVAISNILGQTIANAVVSSDNETIAVPAGIAVVAVEGEEAVKVVVK